MTDQPLSPLDQLAHDLIEDRMDSLGLGRSVVEAQWAVTVADPTLLAEARRHAQFIARLVHQTVGAPKILDLIERFGIDPAPCSFDHDAGCQAHGYLSLGPGEKCPQQEAKDLLAEYGRRNDEGDPQ